MRMRLPTIAISCLAIIGCGKPSTVITGANGEQIVVDHQGKNVTIQSADGSVKVSGDSLSVSLPKSFPKDVPVCDGQVVMASQSGKDYHLMVDTAAGPDSTFRFYSKRLAANGWKIDDETRATDYISLSASKGGRSCMIVASKLSEDGDEHTTVQVVVATQD